MIIRNVVVSDAVNYLKLRVQSEEELPQFVGISVERELAAGRFHGVHYMELEANAVQPAF
jgi:hypothetical protein